MECCNVFSCCSNLKLDDQYVEMILRWSLNRIDRLSDLVDDNLSFIWVVPKDIPALDEEYNKVVRSLVKVIEMQDSLTKDKLKHFLKDFAKENGVTYAVFMKTLRSLLSGLKVSTKGFLNVFCLRNCFRKGQVLQK